MTFHDVIIIGAGPAGMSCAIEARRYGLSVLVLDDQPAAGGQIYRAVAEGKRPGAPGAPDADDVLGRDYWCGADLVGRFRSCGAEYVPGATVWNIERNPLSVHFVRDGKSCHGRSKTLVVANGAYERPVPLPGWTLPGVKTAGAAQILMKTSGLIPGGPVVLAGCGPLLTLVANQLNAAGADVAAVLETTRPGDYLAAAACLPRALASTPLLLKGLKMRRALRASGIRVQAGVSDLRCLGSDAVEAVSFRAQGRQHRIEAGTVLLHIGVVPQVQIARMLGLEMAWHEVQRYWKPRIDQWARADDDDIYFPGDAGGIHGAEAAAVTGRLAALDIARRTGALSLARRDRDARAARRTLRGLTALRPMLDRLYAPPPEILCPETADTIVCRCEEVRVADIRSSVAAGCRGPNQLKAFTRCGMGPCQGRMCGLTAAEVIAATADMAVTEVGYQRVRPPLKPVHLSILAQADTAET